MNRGIHNPDAERANVTIEHAYENGGILPSGPTGIVLSADECVVMAVGERILGEPRALNPGATHYCIRSDHAGRTCVDGVALL